MRAPRPLRTVLPLLSLAVVLVGLVLPATPAMAWRALVLEVTPDTTAGGEQVVVFGEGFRGRGRGSLRWGAQELLRFTADVHGRVHATVTVPTGACGPVEVIATVEDRVARTSVTVSGPQCERSTSELTWRPPDTTGYETLTLSSPGTYELRSDVDYVVSAPTRIDGPVHLRGGRNIVWVGGQIRIPAPGSLPASPASRRALVISDVDDLRGAPDRYGYSTPGRIVHVEGLLIDGAGLTEGINTNAPSAVVQLQNIRVNGVRFLSSDDRDGTQGWTKNHPDVLQTWGSQRELRVDGLTGTSAYQGLFLKEDAVDSVHGPVWLRRVNMRAVAILGNDGYSYAGHRMLSWYDGSVGQVHLDPGTVWVEHHAESGWNRAQPNPDPSTAFWRVRYWSATKSAYVTEPVPGGATFTDALGNTAPDATGVDTTGRYAAWTGAPVHDWIGSAPGRVYSGAPKDGDYVPASTVGTGYVSPGYRSTP